MEVWCLFLAQGVRKKKHITTHKCVFWLFSFHESERSHGKEATNPQSKKNFITCRYPFKCNIKSIVLYFL